MMEFFFDEPGTEAPPEKRTWSNSKLGLLRLCGFAYAQEYVYRVPRRPNPALQGGSSAHEGIALIVRAVLDDDLIDINAMARKVCAGRPQEFGDTLMVLRNIQEALAAEEGDDPIIDPRRVILYEERLSMEITLSDGSVATFDGKPDLVEAFGKVCKIPDWKTHWAPESQEAFENDPQLPRYALLMKENYPHFERFILEKRFVRYRNSKRRREIDASGLYAVAWDLRVEIEEAEAKLARRDFKATPGDWCSLCAYTHTCPVVRDFEANGIDLAIDSDEQAAKVAGTIRAIDAVSGEAKRLLKVYLGGDHPTGRVQLSGGTYGYGPTKRRKADVEDVQEVFGAYGRPVNPHALRVDVKELEKSLAMEPGALRATMQNVIETEEIATCTYRRGDPLTTESEDSEGGL